MIRFPPHSCESASLGQSSHLHFCSCISKVIAWSRLEPPMRPFDITREPFPPLAGCNWMLKRRRTLISKERENQRDFDNFELSGPRKRILFSQTTSLKL
ncbi:hypothetical protein TNCV_2011721 [Trichonephila clavipes]|nr:hypothetical protein TNCV_2011721 [Trichonephila clavipes]